MLLEIPKDPRQQNSPNPYSLRGNVAMVENMNLAQDCPCLNPALEYSSSVFLDSQTDLSEPQGKNTDMMLLST